MQKEGGVVFALQNTDIYIYTHANMDRKPDKQMDRERKIIKYHIQIERQTARKRNVIKQHRHIWLEREN